jgi:hypothetical protein
MTNEKLVLKYLKEIHEEMERASELHPKFASLHEGWAIINEEMDELWDAVKMKDNDHTRKSKCREEAIQVGAMALRFLHDLEDE